MKNKILLFIAAAALLFAGCEGTDPITGDGTVILPDESQKTQTAYADEETTGSFMFVATQSWTAEVKETRSGLSWLRLLNNGKETYEGGAGSFTLQIELDANFTGETRKATIVVQCGESKITITVTQDAKTEEGEVPKDPHPVTGVSVTPTDLDMEVGEKALLAATVTPSDATIKTVTWSSSNTAVATVNASTGEVTAIAEGNAVITATSNADEKITGSCKITVEDEGEEPGYGEGKLTFNNADYDITEASWGGTDNYRDGSYLLYMGFECEDAALDINMFVLREDATLLEGTYTFAEGDKHEKFTISSSSKINFETDDEKVDYTVTGGTVKVEIENGDSENPLYTITLDLQTDGGTLTGQYTGNMGRDDWAQQDYRTGNPDLDAWIVKNYATPGYDTISWVEVPNIGGIDFPYNGSGEKITGMVMLMQFPNITFVNLAGHEIERIRFANGNMLENLNLNNNKINDESLDWGQLDAVKLLNLTGNKILKLSTGSMPLLEYLNCGDSDTLYSLDIMGSPNLKSVDCRNTPELDYINVSAEQMAKYEAEGSKFIQKDSHTIVENL